MLRMKQRGIVLGLVAMLVLVFSLIEMEFMFEFFFALFPSSMRGAEVFAGLPVILTWYLFWSITTFRFLGGVVAIAISRMIARFKK